LKAILLQDDALPLADTTARDQVASYLVTRQDRHPIAVDACRDQFAKSKLVSGHLTKRCTERFSAISHDLIEK
jgi:hypothetical protein